MKRFTKALAAIMLMTAVVWIVGCKTTKDVSSRGKDSHEYVDLGLPSGTLWATCNIGAEKPEDYGDYFAWGETETKDIYNEGTYRWYANGDYNRLTKYCNDSEFGNNGFTDDLTELQASDDPATANWGNGWHTPSLEQWKELVDNTNNFWTVQNDVSGVVFIAENGKKLFLPAAGVRMDSRFKSLDYEGSYWSRAIDTDHFPYAAWCFEIRSLFCGRHYYSRSEGHTVRPVREK